MKPDGAAVIQAHTFRRHVSPRCLLLLCSMRQPSLLVFVSACLYQFKRRMHSPGGRTMSIPPQPNIRILNSPEYRDGYANSVQVRVSVWDFLLIFGRLQPQSTEEVEVHNFQGVYLSPKRWYPFCSKIFISMRMRLARSSWMPMSPRLPAPFTDTLWLPECAQHEKTNSSCGTIARISTLHRHLRGDCCAPWAPAAPAFLLG